MPAQRSRYTTRTLTRMWPLTCLLSLGASGCQGPSAAVKKQTPAKIAPKKIVAKREPDTSARAREILAEARRAAGGEAIDEITRVQRILNMWDQDGHIDMRTILPDQHRIMRCTERRGCHVMAIAGDQAFEQRSEGVRAPLSPEQLRRVRASLWRTYPVILKNAAAPGVALEVLYDSPAHHVIEARPRGLPPVTLTFDEDYLLTRVEDAKLGLTRNYVFTRYEGVLTPRFVVTRRPGEKDERFKTGHMVINPPGLQRADILKGAPVVPIHTFILSAEDTRAVRRNRRRNAKRR